MWSQGSTATPNFGRRNPAKLAPFCSVLLLEKGVREQEAHLLLYIFVAKQ
jgi:hypothetical protein